MTATHTLHVVGKSIGREHGLQPVPVTLPGQPGMAGHLTPAIEEAVRMVRRCMPHSPAPEYRGSYRKGGFVLAVPGRTHGGLDYRIRFYVQEI